MKDLENMKYLVTWRRSKYHAMETFETDEHDAAIAVADALDVLNKHGIAHESIRVNTAVYEPQVAAIEATVDEHGTFVLSDEAWSERVN